MTLLIMAIILIPVAAFTSIALLIYKAIAISNKTIKSTISSSGCTSSLWNFIANPAGRLNIINQCVTVTGTVLSINPQPDGATDFH